MSPRSGTSAAVRPATLDLGHLRVAEYGPTVHVPKVADDRRFRPTMRRDQEHAAELERTLADHDGNVVIGFADRVFAHDLTDAAARNFGEGRATLVGALFHADHGEATVTVDPDGGRATLAELFAAHDASADPVRATQHAIDELGARLQLALGATSRPPLGTVVVVAHARPPSPEFKAKRAAFVRSALDHGDEAAVVVGFHPPDGRRPVLAPPQPQPVELRGSLGAISAAGRNARP